MKSESITRRDALKASGLSLAALSVPSVFATEKEKKKETNKNSRTVFITGGARGIGLKTAETFAKDGINVVLFDIASQIKSVKYPLSTINDLNDAQRKIESLGVKCLAIQGDVRNLEQLKKAVSQTVETFGSLDYLIADAAITQMGEAGSFDEEIITDILAVNVGGVMKTIQAAIPLFKKQKSGRVVAISSIAGRGGAPMFSIYAASKWGVIGLIKSIAQELGSFNVTCNTICPTLVNTLMVNNDHIKNFFNPQNPSLEAVSSFFRGLHTLPLGILEPQEIASAVQYLCSKDAEHISGVVLEVSAGFAARNNA